MKKIVLTKIAAATTAAAMLAGCATTNSSNMTQGQRVGTGAVAGALAGALIGQAIGKDTKGTLIGAVVGGAAGTAGGYIWSQKMQQQKMAMQQVTQGTDIDVTQTADNRLRINIPSDASFATGSAVLNHNMYSVLDRLAQTLLQNPIAMVGIVGHTDSTGSNAINEPLSVNRAQAAKNYLVRRGVPSNRIMITGMGSRQPIADNATQMGRAKNRRVEIYVAEQMQ